MADAIVVGFDGSDGSDRALDRAIADARFEEAQLVVVVVLPLPLDPFAPSTSVYTAIVPDDQTRALGRRIAANDPPPPLRAAIAEAKEQTERSGVDAEIVWRLGEPAKEIVSVANERGATKIIVGPHHHRFLDRLFSEDVTSAVQDRATCELVVADRQIPSGAGPDMRGRGSPALGT